MNEKTPNIGRNSALGPIWAEKAQKLAEPAIFFTWALLKMVELLQKIVLVFEKSLTIMPSLKISVFLLPINNFELIPFILYKKSINYAYSWK